MRNKAILILVLIALAFVVVSFSEERTYALLASCFNNEWAGFTILDVTEPEIPTEVFKMRKIHVTGLDIYDDYLYLSTYVFASEILTSRWKFASTDYIVFDISDITEPKRIATLPTQEGNPCWTARSGNYLYGTAWEAGMHVINAADLSNPVLVNTMPIPGYCLETAGTRDIIVNEDYIYLASYGFLGNVPYEKRAGFYAVDISKREEPEIVEFVGTGGAGVVDFKIYEDIMYCCTALKGIQAFDITDPRKPVLIQTLEYYRANPACIYLDGKYGYVADEWGGLIIIEATDPDNMKLIKQMKTPGMMGQEVVVVDNLLYLADGHAGLEIYSIDDPENPELISQTLVDRALLQAIQIIKREVK